MRALLTGASTILAGGGLCLAGSGAVFAQETPEAPQRVDVHGFVSQGFIKSTANLNDQLFKIEGHYMHGTADLRAALNGAEPDTLREEWGVLLLKTTAYF